MKRLYLVRHAKSDWTYEWLNDIDRPLNERGYRDAYAMSREIRQKNSLPEILISSSATRALSTAMIFLRAFEFGEERLEINRRLFDASPEEVIGVVKGLKNGIQSVMIIGHNPSFTQVAEEFSGKQLGNIPTAGIVCIDFKSDQWINIKNGVLVFFDFPKKGI